MFFSLPSQVLILLLLFFIAIQQCTCLSHIIQSIHKSYLIWMLIFSKCINNTKRWTLNCVRTNMVSSITGIFTYIYCHVIIKHCHVSEHNIKYIWETLCIIWSHIVCIVKILTEVLICKELPDNVFPGYRENRLAGSFYNENVIYLDSSPFRSFHSITVTRTSWGFFTARIFSLNI